MVPDIVFHSGKRKAVCCYCTLRPCQPARARLLRDKNRCERELYEVTRGSRTLAIAAAFPIAGEAVRCMLGASAELASRSVDGRSGGNAASESWVRYHRTFRRRTSVPTSL